MIQQVNFDQFVDWFKGSSYENNFSYMEDIIEDECPHCKYPKARFFFDLRDFSPNYECDKCSGHLDYYDNPPWK
jgi:hypothetical protein